MAGKNMLKNLKLGDKLIGKNGKEYIFLRYSSIDYYMWISDGNKEFQVMMSKDSFRK